MTNEQKQKVLQLLELCIDNNKDGEYVCTFDAYPWNSGSVSVCVYIGNERNVVDERYSFFLNSRYGDQNVALDAAIEAIRTLPERAPVLLAAKEKERRARIEREYAEISGKSTATTT